MKYGELSKPVRFVKIPAMKFRADEAQKQMEELNDEMLENIFGTVQKLYRKPFIINSMRVKVVTLGPIELEMVPSTLTLTRPVEFEGLPKRYRSNAEV